AVTRRRPRAARRDPTASSARPARRSRALPSWSEGRPPRPGRPRALAPVHVGPGVTAEAGESARPCMWAAVATTGPGWCRLARFVRRQRDVRLRLRETGAGDP